eukprot:CAMPEP_0113317720 /NCGR_PEP_ID=MMETSP0010_2-20120614/12513_1 /TAXON_ID=216773 ORGANISM="Corethron hystrix, Strain 308" /NCGR_SAMPLE_ID=MMETSP0010_2 /ASSEMBLY_ACC=CAM_ASM_000155 /LENGTH=308 /DNA_ID=CAMNT_0000174753 /DNA_START=121 /DNA_END=1047 /DNA_ORIENTATION=- /assembly_acc=CAM_ASM_000155
MTANPAASNTSTVQTIGIIGATGKLGRQVLSKLSSRADLDLRCLVRSSEARASLASFYPSATLVRGDVTDASSVENLLEGCDACIAVYGATRRSKLFTDWATRPEDDAKSGHAKQVNYLGVKNIIDVCSRDDSKCKKVVRITGDGEHPWNPFSILINLLGSMAKAWNYEGEHLLRTSNLDYTIIRPGVMSADGPGDTPSLLSVADDGGYLGVSRICYSDVASLVVESVTHPNTARATLAVGTVPESDLSGSKSFAPLLEKIRPDRREFRRDLLEEHFKAVKTGGAVLAATFASFAYFVLSVIGSFLFG